mmetsp:Transcript_10790/g.17771  ORF Transcript_10790/g.17771 Transcript_10790/m.17771 type:complete len:88 (-) Transcript_10790:43-306(-)
MARNPVDDPIFGYFSSQPLIPSCNPGSFHYFQGAFTCFTHRGNLVPSNKKMFFDFQMQMSGSSSLSTSSLWRRQRCLFYLRTIVGSL